MGEGGYWYSVRVNEWKRRRMGYEKGGTYIVPSVCMNEERAHDDFHILVYELERATKERRKGLGIWNRMIKAGM